MAIKIQTEKPVIPIEIGELTFEFELTDENIHRLYQSENEFAKKRREVEGDDLEAAKAMLKESFDFLLGEGTFEKIYELSPSVIILTKYFYSIVDGLYEEIRKKAESASQSKVNKYLNKKK